MIDESRINQITEKVQAMCKNDTDTCTMSKDEARLLAKVLEQFAQIRKDHPFNCYKLNDRDGCPVIYMDIAACYPKEFVMKQIDKLINDKADTTTIRHRLKETCGAVEISPEHLILPHIE